ncbi:MAG: hypothetical protein V3W41_22280 [Planctomycetota bacterium]
MSKRVARGKLLSIRISNEEWKKLAKLGIDQYRSITQQARWVLLEWLKEQPNDVNGRRSS